MAATRTTGAAVFGEFFDSKGYVVADGAMGTQLFARGLAAGDAPEQLNVDAPDTIRQVHLDYLAVGADVVLTNTFGANSYRLRLHNLHTRVGELNEAAARLAQEAADVAAAEGRTVLVAGSMGPTGELLEPLGSMTVAGCEAAFAEQAEGLARGGADVLWIETMSDPGEVEAAVRGIRSACDLPVAVTMSFDTAGRTMMGAGGTEVGERLGGLGLAALGVNCGNDVADSAAAALQIRAAVDIPVIFKPNAGVPTWAGDSLAYDIDPDTLAAYAHRVAAAGVRILGGCCGSTADHIARLSAVLAGEEPVPESPEVAALDARLDPADTQGGQASPTSGPRSRRARRRRRATRRRPRA